MRSECGAGVRLVLRGGRRRSGAHRSGVQRGAPSRLPLWQPAGLRGRARRGVHRSTRPEAPPPQRSRSGAPHDPTTVPPSRSSPRCRPSTGHGAAPIAVHPGPPAPIQEPSTAPTVQPHCGSRGGAASYGSRASLAALSLLVGGGGTRSLPLLGWESAVPPPKWMPPHLGVLCPWPRGSVFNLCPALGMVLTPSPAPLRGGAPPAPLRSQPSDAKQELPWQQVGEFQLLLQQQGQEGGNGGGRGPQMGGQQDLSWGPRLLLPPTNPPPE